LAPRMGHVFFLFCHTLSSLLSLSFPFLYSTSYRVPCGSVVPFCSHPGPQPSSGTHSALLSRRLCSAYHLSLSLSFLSLSGAAWHYDLPSKDSSWCSSVRTQGRSNHLPSFLSTYRRHNTTGTASVSPFPSVSDSVDRRSHVEPFQQSFGPCAPHWSRHGHRGADRMVRTQFV